MSNPRMPMIGDQVWRTEAGKIEFEGYIGSVHDDYVTAWSKEIIHDDDLPAAESANFRKIRTVCLIVGFSNWHWSPRTFDGPISR